MHGWINKFWFPFLEFPSHYVIHQHFLLELLYWGGESMKDREEGLKTEAVSPPDKEQRKQSPTG